jgi:hypothetical protein
MPQDTFLIMTPKSLLKGGSRDHSAVLQYSNDSSKPATIIHVSLFNCFTYSFVLSRQAGGINFPEAQAHKWDLVKKRFGRIPLNCYFSGSDW